MIEPSEELKARFAYLSDEPQPPTNRNPFGESERSLAISEAWLVGLNNALPPPKPDAQPVEPLMQFFEAWNYSAVEFDDQAAKIKIVGNTFYKVARDMVEVLPRNPERTVALRKLLEARDCAMRAAVMK